MASTSQISLFFSLKPIPKNQLEKMKFAFDVSKCEFEKTQWKNHVQTKVVKFRLKLRKFE